MYRRATTGPAVGSEPGKDQDFWAVAAGVLAVQKLLATVTRVRVDGKWVPLTVGLDYSGGPGIFGPRTEAAVKAFQQTANPPADGIAGPNTCKALLRDPVYAQQQRVSMPRNLLWGIIGQESGWDPGAVGGTTPHDLGLVQINTLAHPVPPLLAFDPAYSLPWAADRMKAAHDRYIAKGVTAETAWNLAALYHHAPAWADYWASKGYPPPTYATAAQVYIDKVKKAAATW
jgi:hypothetical protein